MVTWLKRCWILARAWTRGNIITDELKTELAEATRRFVQATAAGGR